MATEEKQEAASAAPATAPASGGGSKLTLILTVTNLVFTLAMAGILFVSFQKEKKQASVQDISLEAGHEGADAKGASGEGGGEHGKDPKSGSAGKSAEFGKMVTLDQFTVNLSTPGSATPKYVRVNISVEVPSVDSENEVNQKMAQVRNTIIDLFNSKRPVDLATAEGRDYLKEEIRNALNGFMVTGKVKAVFFTNFAVTS